MTEGKDSRRLAAILAADVAGYTRLVEQDTDATVADWKKARSDVIEPLITSHAGRIVKLTGDGFLAEFPVVQDAVKCAVAMQQALVTNSLDFRMGVNLGDIVDDGKDIHGEGVNIAARIEALADEGGICVSGMVYDSVRNRIDQVFQDMGLHEVKHVTAPVQVYRIVLNEVVKSPAKGLALPDKPSVAVLPFINLSPDQEQEYFADGLSEDLITALSYVPWVFVIARNSSFIYKDQAVDVRKIGSELGVRYVLEGSLRRSGERLRITSQLVDTANGNHIWADRYDGTLEDVFQLQDSITEEVVNAIAPKIRSVEMERATRKHPDNLTAYDLFLKANAALNNLQIEEASGLLDQAIEVSPDYGKAKAVRAWCYTLFGWRDYIPSEQDQARAIDLANEALANPNIDPETSAYAGYTIAFMKHETERGISLVEDAVQQCPSFAWALASLALLEYYFRSPERAIELGKLALRLNPRDPQNFRGEMAITGAYLVLNQFSESLQYADQGLQKSSNIPFFMCFRITCLVQLGRNDEAQIAADKFMTIHPDFKISEWRRQNATTVPLNVAALEKIEAALNTVGIFK
jgi:adenylate cyclase